MNMRPASQYNTERISTLEGVLLEIFRKDIFDGESSINADSDLFQHGLDSMATMQLLIRIEAEFGVSIPATAMTKDNLSTVQCIARLIHQLEEDRDDS